MENGKRRGGFTLWFTGVAAAGKTTIAEIVERELRMRHGKIEVLDGDIVRTNLSKGLGFSREDRGTHALRGGDTVRPPLSKALGFSREDRDTNVLRIGFVADLLTRNNVGVLVSAISPLKEVRDQGTGARGRGC